MSLRVEVLGPIRVRAAEPIQLRRRSHRRLLAILALDAGRRVSLDRLIDRFWPDEPPATAKAALHTHISGLRRVLGDTAIVTEDGGYRMTLSDGCFDRDEFSASSNQARRAAASREWASVLDHLDKSLGLWRGQPFQELSDDPFAKPDIAQLEEIHLELLELRAEALLASGRPTEATPDLERLVLEHPIRERFWEHLMTARYRIGRNREALVAFREVADHLAEMGLEPGVGLRQLEERILLQDRSLVGTPHNLKTELDSYVPRDSEMRELVRLISDRRMVTLTGTGGSGKTRLAIRTARGLFDRFPDGVWFTDFSGIDDPGLVAPEIARSIGLKSQSRDSLETIVEGVGTTHILLILDNCEHLFQAVSVISSQLLQQAPNLKILATSREPLRCPGETIYQMHGMAVPDESIPDELVAGFESVALFVDRANQARANRPISTSEIPAAANICRRLDGLPLAIELAAARTTSMTVEAIAAHLDDAIPLLTGGPGAAPPRQQTLEATIDWSYRLLDPTERAVFEQLSVFRGGFSLESAKVVVAEPDISVAATVADLVEKSLVDAVDVSEGSRYRMLEAVRQYAGHRLVERGAQIEPKSRHLEWACEMSRDMWQRSLRGDRDGLSRLLDTEVGNVQSALDWARRCQDRTAESVLSQALGWHWYMTGHLGHAAGVLKNVLRPGFDGADVPPIRSLLARCLAYAEDIDGAVVEARAALNDLATVESELLRAWIIATMQLCLFMSARSDPADMLPLASLSLELAEKTSDLHAELIARQTAADSCSWNGRVGEGLKQQVIVLNKAAATQNPEIISQVYGQSIYNYMLNNETRRSEPLRVTKRWHALTAIEELSWTSTATDWLPWVYMQAGDLKRASEMSDRLGNRTLEGYNRTIFLIVRATISWMKGELRSAGTDLSELAVRGVSERWWHVFYPLAAEIAADKGLVEEATSLADQCLSLSVHPTREATKLGCLYPLVRLHVDRAIESGEERHTHLAYETFERMTGILEEYPPLVDSWTSIMTHRQNLVFAESELTRLSSADPDAWAQALETSDHAYYKLYARWRMAQACLDIGDGVTGSAQLAKADQIASSMGTRLILKRIRSTSAATGPIPDG